MAKGAFNFKLSPEGWKEFKDTLEAIGPAGKKAIDQITAASPQLETAFQRAAKEVAAARKEIEGLGTAAQSEKGFGGIARGVEAMETRVKGARRTLSDMQGTLQLIGPIAGDAAAGMGRMVGVVANVADSFGVLSALVRANPIGVLATVAGVAATAYYALRERTNDETEAIKQQADAIKALDADNNRWLKSTDGLTDAQRRLTSEMIRARIEANKTEVDRLRQPEPQGWVARLDRTTTDWFKRQIAGWVESDVSRADDLAKKIGDDQALLNRSTAADEVRLQAAREADSRAAGEQAKAARDLLGALDPLVKINAEYQNQLVKITELRLADALSSEDAAKAYRLAAEQRDAADLKVRLDRADAGGAVDWVSFAKGELDDFRADAALTKRIADQETALRKLIEQAEREAEIAGLTREQREAALTIMKAQQVAGRELTDDERARLDLATRRTVQEDEARKRQEKFARDLERTIEHSTDRAVDIAADTLYDAFTGRIKSVGDFLKTTLLRATAQAASEAVFRPLIQPLVASAVSAAPQLFGVNMPTAASFATSVGGANGGASGGGFGGFSSLLNFASLGAKAYQLFGSGGASSMLSGLGGVVNSLGGSSIVIGGGQTGATLGTWLFGGAGIGGTATGPGGLLVGGGATSSGVVGAGAGSGGLAPFLGPAGLGFGIGMLGGQLFGQTGGIISGGIGGGIAGGALAGTAIFPGIGTVAGAIIGAVAGMIGGALGGMKDEKFPFSKSRATTTDRYGGVTPYAVESLDGGDTTAMNNVVKAIGDTLKGIRQVTGATFNANEKFDVVAGRWAGDFSIFNAGQQFSGNPETATLAMLRYWARPEINAIQGLRPAARQVLQKAGSVADLNSGLAFADQFQDWVEGATEFDKALRTLGRTFDEAARMAEKYGLDIAVVEKERAKSAAALAAQASGQALAPYAPLEQFVNSLSFGNASLLAPRDQLANLRGQYNAALTRARGGDQAALSDVATLAASIYSLDQSYYGVSATTVGDASSLLADARGLLGNAREADPIVRAIYTSGAEGAAKITEALDTVVKRLDGLLEQFTRAAGTPARLLAS